MSKYSILSVAAILCCVQCLPFEATHSTSSSSSQLHLVVNNSTQSTNYHLTPVMSKLENIDDEIDTQLKAILPYLNFFFDSLLGRPPTAEEEDCINDMVIEMVPDETAMPPKTESENKSDTTKDEESSDKNSEDKPASDTVNTEEKSEDNSNDKPEPNEESATNEPDKQNPKP
ncbi:uncharacterized protein LOC112046649 [Bicyclus anynana]|uniref:Uncharacterized protein LOC112046649 n=1 Tax=Bicyclus anynana TaxID=110368 RepID=A0A6J1N297_BICAN|nr:uncharacterized protein LOC112046649 [Bicyclus anynana]